MRKLLVLFLLVVSLSSCVKISYFDVKNVNDVKLSNMSMNGAEVLVDITFESDKTTEFTLSKLELALDMDESNIATIVLPHKVKIITNDVNVKIPLSINIPGGILGAATIMSRIEKNMDRIVVNGYVVVTKGALVKKFKIKELPVKELYDGASKEKFNIKAIRKFLR